MTTNRYRLPVKRTLATWAITALSLLLLAYVLPGLALRDTGTAIVAAALIGILNALLWPVLVRLTLPLNMLTFGAFTVVLNGFIVWLAAEIDTGMTVRGFYTAIVVALGLAAINTLLSSLLSIDDDNSY
jgi:uncharacterized membrane protein YvlD (DUF360 family)